MFCLCLNCEHAGVDADGYFQVSEEAFAQYCIDCPLVAYQDSVHEAEAEAMFG